MPSLFKWVASWVAVHALCATDHSSCVVQLLLLDKRLPFAVVQLLEAGQGCNRQQVLREIQQLFVGIAREVCTLEWPNHQAILFIENIVAPKVIKHDGVVLIVMLREFGPQHRQRFAVKHFSCHPNLLSSASHLNQNKGAGNGHVCCNGLSESTGRLNRQRIRPSMS